MSTTPDSERSSFTFQKDEILTASPTVSENTRPKHPVDGGRRAWCTLIGGFLVIFVCSGYVNAFGVYQDVYTRRGAGSAGQVSWIGSLQFFLSYAIGYPVGLMMDKGYFAHVNWIGTFIFSFSLFMASLAHNDQYYQIFLSMGLGLGIGAGMLYMPAVAVQAHHWDKRRALAMGVVVSGAAVGGVVYAIMLNKLFDSPIGFEWGVRISAFISVGLLVLGCSLMSTNPDRVAKEETPSTDLKKIIFDAAFILSTLGVLITFMGFFFPYFYLQLFSVLHGVDTNVALNGIAIMSAASIIGRVFLCYLADGMGTFNSTIACVVLCGGLVFAMLGINNSATSIIFAIVYGIFSGGVLGLTGPLFASLSRSPSEVGATVGIAYTLCSLGALVGPPIDGALLTKEYHWSKAIIFSGIACMIGIALLVASRHLLSRKRNTIWL